MYGHRTLFEKVFKRILSKQVPHDTTLRQLGIKNDEMLIHFLEYAEEEIGIGADNPALFFLSIYRRENPTVLDVRRRMKKIGKMPRSLVHGKQGSSAAKKTAAAEVKHSESTRKQGSTSSETIAAKGSKDNAASEDDSETETVPSGASHLRAKSRFEFTPGVSLATPARLTYFEAAFSVKSLDLKNHNSY